MLRPAGGGFAVPRPGAGAGSAAGVQRGGSAWEGGACRARVLGGARANRGGGGLSAKADGIRGGHDGGGSTFALAPEGRGRAPWQLRSEGVGAAGSVGGGRGTAGTGSLPVTCGVTSGGAWPLPMPASSGAGGTGLAASAPSFTVQSLQRTIAICCLRRRAKKRHARNMSPIGNLASERYGESMVFSQRLEIAARLVEGRLGSLFESLARQGTPPRLMAAMRHAALGGGKRLRPFLVLEAARLFGVPSSAALTTAAAVECVHCYSLVHDDLPAMDNDAVRRGKPTVHKAFDEWTAILAGDGLLTVAFALLAGPDADHDPAVRAELVCGLAAASGAAGMVGGQCLDLEADKLKRPPTPDLDHVQRLQAMKTGALIKFACEAGALLGRATPAERTALAGYGEKLGLAFQIADDLLDAEGDAVSLGKATRKDAGKATFVAVVGVASAKQRLSLLVDDIATTLEALGPKAEGLRQAARFVVSRTS